MRNVLVMCLLLCIAGSIAALEPFSPDGISFGIGPEVNAFSRDSAAIGGNLFFGLELNSKYTIGLKAAFYHNMDTVGALEPLAYFRYYLPYWRPLQFDGPFIQTELGFAVLFEDGEAFPAFSGAVTSGWRFNFAKQWFVEPAVRLGYPFNWGFNLTAGYSFLFNIGQ